jgi:hypothetical protein
VDKYNLIFTYFKKYESGGKIRESVKNFMLLNLYVYMLVIMSFFGFLFRDKPFYWIGILLIILWTVIYIYVSKYKNNAGVKAILEKFYIFQKENNEESLR